MKIIVLAVCWVLAIPVVSNAGDNDALKVLLSGIGGWADSEKKQRRAERQAAEEEEDDSFTIKPGLGSERECDGLQRYTIEKNGKTYLCRESVTCKVTCEEQGW